MPKAAHAPSPQIAHVSITLDDVVPEVSRIVAMPLGIRLDMLHLIIQAAMGWTNSHLWLIHARGSTWGVPDPDFPDDTIPANRTSLLDMIADIGTNRFEYVYDLGDHWSDTIKIVKPMPAVPGIDYPLLIDAVGRCPLEDSGGPPGYMDMLEPYATRPIPPCRGGRVAWSDFDPNDANHAKLETDVAALANPIAPRRRASVKPKPKQKRRKRSDDEMF